MFNCAIPLPRTRIQKDQTSCGLAEAWRSIPIRQKITLPIATMSKSPATPSHWTKWAIYIVADENYRS